MKKVMFALVVIVVVAAVALPGVALANGFAWETNGPEVSVSDNTIVMGPAVAPLEADTQPIAISGATIEIPPCAQVYVEFDYSLNTWDSYNPSVGAGTGYWDSFTISVSQDKYWNLTLTDPADTDADLAVGFIWGGILYGDGVLDTTSGTGSATMAASTTSTNYLNVVLDTATLPQADANYPSWGEITITKLELLGVPEVTKELVAAEEVDGDMDGNVDVGEDWNFTLLITVTNNTPVLIASVVVKDNFGGDLELVTLDGVAAPLTTNAKKESYPWTGVTESGTVQYTGKTDKAHLWWTVGPLAPAGGSASLIVVVSTDMNPAGHQQYTSGGEHCLNSGATAKGLVTLASGVWEVEDTTDEICVQTGSPPPIANGG